jgi:large subunit ribosomal protein L24
MAGKKHKKQKTKKKWSKSWKSSRDISKQRKYRYNAPLHIKQKIVSANLSEQLRQQYNIRSLPLRKGDVVMIMRGEHKKKKGKIEKIDLKRLRIYIENINQIKQDGRKIPLPLDHSNVQIIELNVDDKKRINSIERKKKKQKATKKDKTENKNNK